MKQVHSQKQTLVVLQYVRFLAALFVVIDHGVLELISRGFIGDEWKDNAISLGRSGVFIFFAISGYVMVLGTQTKFGSGANAKEFMIRRLIRIVPLYATATLIYFAVQYGNNSNVDFLSLLKSLLFIPYQNNTGGILPIVGKGWTLNYEMFFYAVFALGMLAPLKVGLKLIIFVLFLLGCAGVMFDMTSVFAKFYLNIRILYFLVGIGVFLAFQSYIKRQFLSDSLSFFSTTIGLMILAWGVFYIEHEWAVIASFVVTGIILLLAVQANGDNTDNKNERFVIVLGDASYALYLFHGISYRVTFHILEYTTGVSSLIVTFVLYVILAVAISLGIHFCYDQPIQRTLIHIKKSLSK